MRDRYFFPAALLLAVMLVALAMRPAAGALPSGSVSGGGTDYSSITIRDANLNRIIAGGESKIELLGEKGERTLRIETEVGMLQDDPVKGPHFRLAADLENVYQGRTLEVTMRVKPSDKYGAAAFMANYSTGKNGETGWKVFALGLDYADYTFTYDVPLRGVDHGVDYLALRPVTPEKRRAIEIERITLKPLAAWTE